MSQPPSTSRPAQRFHARALEVFLQRSLRYGEATSAPQKKIFAAPAPVPARFPARADNAGAVSAKLSAGRVQPATGASSSALRFLQQGLHRTKCGVPASCPEFRLQKHPPPAATLRA